MSSPGQSTPEAKSEEAAPPPAAKDPPASADPAATASEPLEEPADGQGDDSPSRMTLNPKAAEFTPTTPSPKRRQTTSTSAQTDPTTPRTGRPTHTAPLKKTTPAAATAAPSQQPPSQQPPAAAEAEVKQEEGKAATAGEGRAAPTRTPTEKGKVKEFDNEAVLQNLIRAQIDFFFSDYHLTNDTYLLARMSEDPQHWVGVDLLAKMPRIRQLTNKRERVQQALLQSEYLEVSPDKTKVRRPSYALPRPKPNRDLRRTVFLYGIPPNKTEEDLRSLLSTYGDIKKVVFDVLPEKKKGDGSEAGAANGARKAPTLEEETGDTPIREVALLIMQKKFLHPRLSHDGDDEQRDPKKYQMMASLYAHPVRNPNGDAQDFSHLRSSFVVFESQSQATKCVKARVRAVDGMRSIHKYDYQKIAKKFRTAQMKGENLTFSPMGGGIARHLDHPLSSGMSGRHHPHHYNGPYNRQRGYQRNGNGYTSTTVRAPSHQRHMRGQYRSHAMYSRSGQHHRQQPQQRYHHNKHLAPHRGDGTQSGSSSDGSHGQRSPMHKSSNGVRRPRISPMPTLIDDRGPMSPTLIPPFPMSEGISGMEPPDSWQLPADFPSLSPPAYFDEGVGERSYRRDTRAAMEPSAVDKREYIDAYFGMNSPPTAPRSAPYGPMPAPSHRGVSMRGAWHLDHHERERYARQHASSRRPVSPTSPGYVVTRAARAHHMARGAGGGRHSQGRKTSIRASGPDRGFDWVRNPASHGTMKVPVPQGVAAGKPVTALSVLSAAGERPRTPSPRARSPPGKHSQGTSPPTAQAAKA